jgi:probable rRNA maturation factor
MNLTLHVSRAAGLSRAGIPSRALFEQWATAALRGVRRRRDTEFSIHIVDAEEGQAINLQYRGRDYATNVLSFPADLPRGVKLPLIGDLIFCAPVVAREAIEQKKPLRDHYAHMTIHGVLHLLGHDHEIEIEAERMEALERRVLAELGIADPYLEIDAD